MARTWMKEKRRELGITEKEAGEAIGISESYYCCIEAGVRQKKMDLQLVSRLANLFQMTVDEIILTEAKTE